MGSHDGNGSVGGKGSNDMRIPAEMAGRAAIEVLAAMAAMAVMAAFVALK